MGALIAAACMLLVTSAVVHGALRPLLEARGVTPWRLRDTLASTPLILLGSGGIGAASSLLSQAINEAPANGTLEWRLPGLLLGTIILLISSVMLWLGILALRKLA